VITPHPPTPQKKLLLGNANIRASLSNTIVGHIPHLALTANSRSNIGQNGLGHRLVFRRGEVKIVLVKRQTRYDVALSLGFNAGAVRSIEGAEGSKVTLEK
jgi:hypothetical protein